MRGLVFFFVRNVVKRALGGSGGALGEPWALEGPGALFSLSWAAAPPVPFTLVSEQFNDSKLKSPLSAGLEAD